MNNLVGKIFGLLTVLERRPSVRRNGRSMSVWKCSCSCGNYLDVFGEYLNKNVWRSCGCSKRKRAPYGTARQRLTTETAAINSIQSQYICRARRLGQEYTLTREQFVRLISVPCHYCGDSNTATWTRRGRTFAYTGVDRVDSSRGYVIGNVVPCCTYCNRAKSNQSLDDFLERVEKIHAKHSRTRRKGGTA